AGARIPGSSAARRGAPARPPPRARPSHRRRWRLSFEFTRGASDRAAGACTPARGRVHECDGMHDAALQRSIVAQRRRRSSNRPNAPGFRGVYGAGSEGTDRLRSEVRLAFVGDADAVAAVLFGEIQALVGDAQELIDTVDQLGR